MIPALTGAFVGHVLAGFILGGLNFFLGFWMAQRSLQRAFAHLEHEMDRQRAEVIAAMGNITADQHVHMRLRRNEPRQQDS